MKRKLNVYEQHDAHFRLTSPETWNHVVKKLETIAIVAYFRHYNCNYITEQLNHPEKWIITEVNKFKIDLTRIGTILSKWDRRAFAVERETLKTLVNHNSLQISILKNSEAIKNFQRGTNFRTIYHYRTFRRMVRRLYNAIFIK